MPRHFSKQRYGNHFYSHHSDVPRKDLDIEIKIKSFFKNIIVKLTNKINLLKFFK